MPPRSKRAAQELGTGWKFTCQFCEGEVNQGVNAQLMWHIQEHGSGRNKMVESIPYQCCIDCADEVRSDNADYYKRNPGKKPVERQVMPLRDAQQLDAIPEIAAAKAEAENSLTVKIDKLTDIVATLAQMMTMQMQQDGAKKVVAAVATIPKPEPKKTNATSQRPKPKATKAKAAKPKPRKR